MTSYLYPAFAILCAVIGLAVMWGTYKAMLENLRKQVDQISEAVKEMRALICEVREEMRVRFASVETSKLKVLNGRKKR